MDGAFVLREAVGPMPKPIPPTFETYDALTVDSDGATIFLAAKPLADASSFEGYLIPYYTLSDRGTFFVPGSAKRTANARMKDAPHLWQHDTDEVLGKHVAADAEDPKGFRIAVEVTDGVQRADELMMHLRKGVSLGLSVGFDPVADRSGTEADDKLLNRKTALAYFKDVPINELRAITEFRWWESSTVTFAGIASAKPDVVHASDELLATILQALKDGTATPEQLAAARAIVAAAQVSPAPGASHGTDEDAAKAQRLAINYAQIRAAEMTATYGAAA